ncbi:MAG TPA: glycosyltransferase family 4 protein [Thermoanaerobaculia bacterium]|nr:glycosyltransferase family 4 protein [Thermoanaerobaculia bacterium]
MLTPLPPARTGVAHYASMVLPALGERVELVDEAAADVVIYQLGNNPHHEEIYAAAMRRPGVVVLHDLVLHHLIVEMTLARGDAEGYVAALRANHGEPGAAWARGRAAGLHSEMGNFLLPASVEVAQRALSVIVHNRYAAERLRSFGVTTPIHVVPHPYVPETRAFPRTLFPADHRVIGFFGFLTSAKRAEVVLEAFRIARGKEPKLELLIVGEPAPNIDMETIRGERITLTGYVSDEEFARYYAEADRFVNLRYPTAGETSGTLIRALDAGKPVAVSDYAQFAELPDNVAFKVPLGEGEVERLVAFFLDELPDPRERQRAWLEEHASLARTIDGYLEALECGAGFRPPGRAEARPTLPLFPALEVVSTNPLILRNSGPTTIRTRTYGQPELRVIVRSSSGDEWLSLPTDLHPGESAELRPRATEFTVHYALQDIPDV